eukprot:scaffold4106_cov64-Cylindrotheca_fusiformis.AAC.1
MEETDLHKPLLLESQEDGVVEQALEEEEDKQRSGLKKVWLGLIALVLAIAAVIAFCNNGSQPLSDIDLLATVVMPGVDISNLNETTPQYRALEWLAYNDTRVLTIWLAYNDTRGLTINDDAIELLERFSLATFYYSVGGDSLPKFDNDWLTISSHCDWRDVNCDEDGRVTALKIYHSKMHGTLPTEIGNLKRLRDLNLSLNELVGPIPSEIGNLQQLNRLRLDGNKFSGPIPSEIGHLQQLKHLGLQGNELSGPIP